MSSLAVIVVLVGVYALLGVLVGGAYLLRGAARDDESLRDSALHVRLLLLPGSIAVWPLLLPRLIGRAENRS
ncbi:MAG: hypothetical protein ACF8MJ_14030 [Phycisphaerales bacterium JB050]